MTASVHLARFAPGRAGRMLARMRAHHRALLGQPEISFARFYMLATLDPVSGGTPVPTRWALLIGWADEPARSARLCDGRLLEPFIDGVRECWSVCPDPYRVRPGDDLGGWRPSPSAAARADADGPVFVITHGRVVPRHLWTFTRHNATIVREMAAEPGLAVHLACLDHLMTRATFSLWRSRRAAIDFAYRSHPHAPVQQAALTGAWADRWFFARFVPTASSGTWLGRDPLADLTAPGPAVPA